MNYLYLIGGSTRSGKTTILHKIIARRPMIAIQTDAMRDGLRKALIDEISAPISHLSFSGDVTFQRSEEDSEKESLTKHFAKEISQSELVWNAIVGLINYYENKSVDLIIEGMEITPERVKGLTLKNFLIKPVFVGFTEDTNFNKIIADLDKNLIKKRFDEHVEEGKKIAVDADKYGYKFFSFDNDKIEEYCNNVISYLLDQRNLK